jgi:predicted NAD/FAD-dependent oxidoreductase
MPALRVAVVGAGMAGLACAGSLARHGAQVSIFDKGRGPGGRVATRLTEHGSFDHGAQYFTVHTHAFESHVQRWRAAGAIAAWTGPLVAFSHRRLIESPLAAERLVGVGGMNALGRHLAQGLEIACDTQVARLERRGGLWMLYDARNRPLAVRGFDAVVVTAPSPQAAELLRDLTPLAAIAAAVRWEPCWTALLALSRSTGAGFEAAYVGDDPILGWISRDDRKAERARVSGVAERWVLHANARWSRKYFDLAPEAAAHWLGRAFSARLGRPVTVRSLVGHRWRYAMPVRPLGEPYLWDRVARVGLAGDWCDDPRIEGAFLSGLALAAAVAA